MSLAQKLAERVQSNLEISTIASCSSFASRYRIMSGETPGPWSDEICPWAKEIHNSTHPYVVAKKGAQLSFTEIAINRCFYYNIVKKRNALYVLANKRPMCAEFSQTRFDPALELSPFLKKQYIDTNSMFVKRAGVASLFVRGSRAPNELKSVPASFVVLDELDEMIQKHIPLAIERTAGQAEFAVYALSTPTISDYGVDFYYSLSDQRHFFFVCPHCGRYVDLTYPDSFVLCGESSNDPKTALSHIICKLCKHPLDHRDKISFLKTGKWVATRSSGAYSWHGYYLNQLYSTKKSPERIAQFIHDARYNPAIEQQLYNSLMGLTKSIAGGRLTELEVLQCKGNHMCVQKRMSPDPIITFGIDVGAKIHVYVDEWWPGPLFATGSIDHNLQYIVRTLAAYEVERFEDLDMLFYAFTPNCVCIDKDPETRSAMELAARFPGIVYLCDYVEGITGSSIRRVKDTPFIKVDRTYWLDTSLPRFKNKTISIPINISKDVTDHMQAPERIYRTNPKTGKVSAAYVNNKADHYAHARNFSEIALKMYLCGADSLCSVQEFNDE